MVSHDRGFIRRIATKILEVKQGTLTLYPGTYDEYVWSLQQGVLSSREENHSFAPKKEKKEVKSDRKQIELQVKQINREIEAISLEIQEKAALQEQIAQKLSLARSDEAKKLSQESRLIAKKIQQLEEDLMAGMLKIEALASDLQED
jgi:ATP-binding cassette subfamily F protein 3